MPGNTDLLDGRQGRAEYPPVRPWPQQTRGVGVPELVRLTTHRFMNSTVPLYADNRLPMGDIGARAVSRAILYTAYRADIS